MTILPAENERWYSTAGGRVRQETEVHFARLRRGYRILVLRRNVIIKVITYVSGGGKKPWGSLSRVC